MPDDVRTISGVATSVTSFVGTAAREPVNKAVHISAFADFERHFGGLSADSEMSYGVSLFFRNGGKEAWVVRVIMDAASTDVCPLFSSDRDQGSGIYALEQVDSFNLLCLPGISDNTTLLAAAAYSEERRAFLIVDAPLSASSPADMAAAVSSGTALPGSDNAAVYYPWLRIVDPIEIRKVPLIAPSGAVAGLYARTDGDRGVWKAPAGAEANLVGVKGVAYPLSGRENDSLNSLGVNCLRVFPEHGVVSWGARTLRGADRMNSEYKYVPVRRLALFIEESLYRGTRWVVFEPNDESLWAQIRLGIDAFMNNLFRRGAFQGNTPPEAYLVRCCSDTTTREDIDRGFVNILVGFAALKPAEFVIIRIQQLAGQVQGEDPRMTESTASARRVDPYKDYRFRVKWDGRYVAGFSKVSALKRTTEVVKHREGGNPGHCHKSSGRSGFEAITLKRGITHDTGFGEWASKAWNATPDQEGKASLKDFRKDLVIECYDEVGQLAMTYKVSRSWVSEYTAMPELDANANAVAIESMTLENEGLVLEDESDEPG